jgi:hypothetical protein
MFPAKHWQNGSQSNTAYGEVVSIDGPSAPWKRCWRAYQVAAFQRKVRCVTRPTRVRSAEGVSSSQRATRIAMRQVPGAIASFLTPASSTYVALRSARRYQPRSRSGRKGWRVHRLGFRISILKMCSRAELCPAGVESFGRGAQGSATWERCSSRDDTCLRCSLPVPPIPLRWCPDMIKPELADKYNFFLCGGRYYFQLSQCQFVGVGSRRCGLLESHQACLRPR